MGEALIVALAIKMSKQGETMETIVAECDWRFGGVYKIPREEIEQAVYRIQMHHLAED
jgi:hypothetical protein